MLARHQWTAVFITDQEYAPIRMFADWRDYNGDAFVDEEQTAASGD